MAQTAETSSFFRTGLYLRLSFLQRFGVHGSYTISYQICAFKPHFWQIPLYSLCRGNKSTSRMKLQNQRTSYLFPFQMEKQFLNQAEQPTGFQGHVCKQKLQPFGRRGSRRPGSAVVKRRRCEKAKENTSR